MNISTLPILVSSLPILGKVNLSKYFLPSWIAFNCTKINTYFGFAINTF